jgi:hypothetical protein
MPGPWPWDRVITAAGAVFRRQTLVGGSLG